MNKLFKDFRFRSLVVGLFILVGTQAEVAWAQETCEIQGVEFGFFNGVQTNEDDAQETTREYLPRQYGTITPDGKPITYTLYYNDTDAGLADFVETFDQRLQEQEGLLAGRFELFFSALEGGGPWWDRIREVVPSTAGLLLGLMDTYQARLISHLGDVVDSPDTFLISQRHRDQINHAAAMDKALLFFAHSQGNLFVNQAYDHALTQLGAESVRVVHVAPASPRKTGTHTLAVLDLVINGLRAVGSVLPNTDVIPTYGARPPGLNGKRDFMGHSLLAIYLNPQLTTSSRIRSQVTQALEALRSPQRTTRPPYPNFEAIPWAGGPRPVFVAQHVASHELESMSGTRSNNRTSPSEGYTALLKTLGDTESGYPYWYALPTRKVDLPVGATWRSSFSNSLEGRGVSGSMACESEYTGSCAGVGQARRYRHQCTLNNVLTWPNPLNLTDQRQPTELEVLRNTTPRGSEVMVSSWTTLSTPRTRNLGRRSGQLIAFRAGEIRYEAEWRGVAGDYPGSYRCEYRRLTDINTVLTYYEPFSWQDTGTEEQNAALQRWDIAYGEWQDTERQRYADHLTRLGYYNAWRQTCVTPPPAGGGGEECNYEDPLNECGLPSGVMSENSPLSIWVVPFA